MTASDWKKMLKQLKNKPAVREKYIKHGKLVLKYEKVLIDKIIENAQPVNFQGYRTLAVNSPIFESVVHLAIYDKADLLLE